MPSFQRVLLATDFSAASKAAFDTALGLCVRLKATLLLLHVFEYAETGPPDLGGQLVELEGFLEEARTRLDGLMKVAMREGVVCETVMGSGAPAPTILDAIAGKEIDLAVLGTSALHGFERLVFGSVAEDVLRGAPCPVLTVGPRIHNPVEAAKSEGPAIFATDFDANTLQAIRYAETFCKEMGTPLHCLHILPRAIEGKGENGAVLQIMTEALQQVSSEAGAISEPPVCAIAYGSEVSNAVVDYATKKNAKLIVLGVRQASMMSSHIPAHIAFRIITEAPCPVLTMAFPSRKHSFPVAACL